MVVGVSCSFFSLQFKTNWISITDPSSLTQHTRTLQKCTQKWVDSAREEDTVKQGAAAVALGQRWWQWQLLQQRTVKLKSCLATEAAVEGPTALLQSDFWKEVSVTRQRKVKGRRQRTEGIHFTPSPQDVSKRSAYGHLVLLHSLWDSPYWART